MPRWTTKCSNWLADAPVGSYYSHMGRRNYSTVTTAKVVEAIDLAGESLGSVARATDTPVSDLRQLLNSERPITVGDLGRVGGFLRIRPSALVGGAA